jgi:hypothetical protein
MPIYRDLICVNFHLNLVCVCVFTCVWTRERETGSLGGSYTIREALSIWTLGFEEVTARMMKHSRFGPWVLKKWPQGWRQGGKVDRTRVPVPHVCGVINSARLQHHLLSKVIESCQRREDSPCNPLETDKIFMGRKNSENSRIRRSVEGWEQLAEVV